MAFEWLSKLARGAREQETGMAGEATKTTDGASVDVQAQIRTAVAEAMTAASKEMASTLGTAIAEGNKALAGELGKLLAPAAGAGGAGAGGGDKKTAAEGPKPVSLEDVATLIKKELGTAQQS